MIFTDNFKRNFHLINKKENIYINCIYLMAKCFENILTAECEV